MRRGPIGIMDPSRESAVESPRASWYTPGLSDGLGDRLLMFDNTTASSLELLRFRPEFGDHPEFERALRRRLDELADFQHPSVASVRAVKRLGDGDGLALVSNYVAGRRLSELLHEPRGAALALELVRQLTPVLALLEREGEGIAHGALTADRVVVTPEGRLVMVEHVLGPALAALGLPAGRIRLDLGLAILPGSDGITVGGRADVVQLALMAVSLVLGRRVHPGEYPECVPGLLEEMRDSGPGVPTPPLKIWLMRALHPGGDAFQSADEAHRALAELLDGTDARLTDRPRPLAFPKPADPAVKPRPRRDIEFPAEPAPAAAAAPTPRMERPAEAFAWPAAPAATPAPAAAPVSAPWSAAVTASAPATKPGTIRVPRWAAAAVVLVAVAQAAVIAGLLLTRRSAPANAAAGSASLQTPRDAAADTARIATNAGAPATAAPAASDAGRPAAADAGAATPADSVAKTEAKPAPPAPSIGGVRITSSIELQVFEDGTPVGSTAGAMALSPGVHALELVNNLVGYRTRQVVQVKAGITTPVTITPPNGRLSINAMPWAEVFIDGRLAGETPLANLSVPLGEHQILFRHPQLGEQRQTALVKFDTPARVTANLQR